MKKTNTQSLDSFGSSLEASSERVSLDVLCRRAERLIDSVRMMGEQVDQLFSRPDRAVAEANATARTLLDLKEQVQVAANEARQAEQLAAGRVDELKGLLPGIQRSAEGLIQRVLRARELTDAIGKLMDGAGEKIAKVDAAADEARKAREAIATAMAELVRVQKVADGWSASVKGLTAKFAELIASGNTGAQRLRTLMDAGERLRESTREDIVVLRELMRESRTERLAWEQLLTRVPATMPAVATVDAGANAERPNGKSVQAVLADRVRKVADLVRQTAGLADLQKDAVVGARTAPARLSPAVVKELVKDTTN